MMRKGFGIVYAVVILVLIATIAVYMLEISGRNAKTAADEHIRMQLRLYMKSSLEYALLWMGTDRSRSQNVQDLNITYDDHYHIAIRIEPVGDVLPPESNGTVVIDQIGFYNAAAGETVRMFSRQVLKP